jgi:hypothetical protein
MSKPSLPQSKARRMRSPTQLDRLLRRFAAPIDVAAVDRILATVSLANTTGVLAPGVDAATLDEVTAAEIKRARWGGAVGTMMGFLMAIVARRREMSKSQALARVRKSPRAMKTVQAVLRYLDPSSDDKLPERMLWHMKDAQWWTTERIVGEFLPAQYQAIFGKWPAMTRGGEHVKFIQAVLGEIGIHYADESIIRALQDAKPAKPKRHR